MNTLGTLCCKDILGIKILLNTVTVSVNLKSSIIHVEEMKCLKGESVLRVCGAEAKSTSHQLVRKSYFHSSGNCDVDV